MDYIKLRARAKINTALDVLRKRDDGYHDLRMVMQTVNICDTLFIKKQHSGISLKSNLSWLPVDSRNLVYRAAQTLIERYNIPTGVYIELNKNIPVAAGLAGGSSDCATTLIGMRNLFRLPISNIELMSIGKELGADVPYCIMRGTALAEGIGEKLTPLPPFPNCFVLLAKPTINVSTATIFKSLDFNNITERPDIEQMIYYLENNDLTGICSTMCNVLETVTIPLYPIIADIKQSMLDKGAVGSMMSGSGPTVFGFFTEYEQGLEALKYIRKEFRTKDVFLTTVFNKQ